MAESLFASLMLLGLLFHLAITFDTQQEKVFAETYSKRSKGQLHSFCRQFDDSQDCTANGCCLANYTVPMKTMRGIRQISVSECVPTIQENHFCIARDSPIRMALSFLTASATSKPGASKVIASFQCPCATGLQCLSDPIDNSISICRRAEDSSWIDLLTTPSSPSASATSNNNRDNSL